MTHVTNILRVNWRAPTCERQRYKLILLLFQKDMDKDTKRTKWEDVTWPECFLVFFADCWWFFMMTKSTRSTTILRRRFSAAKERLCVLFMCSFVCFYGSRFKRVGSARWIRALTFSFVSVKSAPIHQSLINSRSQFFCRSHLWQNCSRVMNTLVTFRQTVDWPTMSRHVEKWRIGHQDLLGHRQTDSRLVVSQSVLIQCNDTQQMT